MKIKNLLLAILLLLTNAAFAQFQFEKAKQIYEKPQFMNEVAKHKTVAILPFEADIQYKRPPKGSTPESLKEEEQAMAKDLQQAMYTFLLRKGDDYTVKFQDVTRTNSLLKQKGLYNKLDEVTQDSLCKALNVDAVVLCRYSFEKTSSEAGAIAKAVLLGGAGKTGSGMLTMQLYNGADGELLWRFTKAMNDTAFSSHDDLMERMMRKVARNFPYDKDSVPEDKSNSGTTVASKGKDK